MTGLRPYTIVSKEHTMPSTCKISLIIPVFNVEPWLNDCLSSVQNQSFQDWEAILINDCSQDASKEIMESYAGADQRYTILEHTKNMGLGAARNTGCQHAGGEFLCFLDSDDVLANNALENLYQAAQSHGADMVIGDFHTFIDKKEKPHANKNYPLQNSFLNFFPKETETLDWTTLKDKYEKLILSSFTITCWGKLFRRQLWAELNCHVPENLLMAEDIIPVKKFFHSSKIIVSCPFVTVLYRRRYNSNTGQRTKKSLEILRAYPLAMESFQSIPHWKTLRLEMEKFFIRSFRFSILFVIPRKDWWHFYTQCAPLIAKMEYAKTEKKLDGLNLHKWKRKSFIVFLHLMILTFNSMIRSQVIYHLPPSWVRQLRVWFNK